MPWKESYDQPRQHIIKQRHYFANKGLSSQGCGFSSSRVWTWELDYKESWAQKIDAFELWCWRSLLRVPWTSRRCNQSLIKESSPDCSLEGLMLKPKLQYFGHQMWRADSLKKTLGKDWRQEKKGVTEDEMVRWHHRLNGHEFVWTPGVGDGQGGLVCCGSLGLKDWATELNWTERLLK